ncbi:protein translocase subunit SecD [Luteimicrobium album]|uniref:Protein translocase subunit SecD n=1 Tax=Luteimicrobium album TaxID=1054550 RepID=A0ABQ6I530_9MICO|nr:protein translocase subunit SecD [Luteimicrobium album]GMA25873.1 protein translocase subunit SecD [Luteimicrobium album]
MATTNHAKSHPGRVLLILLILAAALFGTIGLGAAVSNASWAPKLALDLEGGTQLTLKASTTDGSKVTSDSLDQAIDVIRNRVDSSGVSEAQISKQGDKQIVVALPGNPSQDTIDLVSKSAQMRIRPVLVIGSPLTAAQQTAAAATPTETSTPAPTSTSTPQSTPTATNKNSAYQGAAQAHVEDARFVKGTAKVENAAATPSPTPTPTSTSDTSASSSDSLEGGDGLSSLSQITAADQKRYDDLDCTDKSNLKGGGGDAADKVLVTCAQDGTAKYILGPVEIEGTEIKSATSGLNTNSQGVTTNEWVVNIKFTSDGAKKQTAMTKRLAQLDQAGQAPRNQFGMVLDGLVIEAPSVDAQYASTGITGNSSQISGSFTRQSAATLANQLNFGALPLQFEVQSQEQISATLGSEQLQKGLLAGLIGMVLVVIYSMFQYRMLGLLTIASLVVAGVLTYGVITLLSWRMGYRLSLPGVAGLIVAIGFTADSFIVYFERIRDELRDGRPLAGAVERGWERARRTVLAAKTVNLISAIVLYYLAVGGVQGFAFTLGLTVIIDVVVVFWFTHPMMELLARVPYFRDGAKGSGLSPATYQVQRGMRYKGAGKFETAGVPADAPPPSRAPTSPRSRTRARSCPPGPTGARAPRASVRPPHRRPRRTAAA